MEKLVQMFIGLGILYAIYALAIKNWDYTSQAKRDALRTRLKEQGLSSCYYFIPPLKLLLLNILSGGLFLFYWAFKQWQAVISGYKNTAGKPLRGGAWLRGLLGLVSFYQLCAIVNRTCQYMRKKPSFPAGLWGTLFIGGLVTACVPAVAAEWRAMGAILFLLAPYILQRRINTLPKEIPPSRLKILEIIWVPLGWLLWAGIYFMYKTLA